MTTEDKLNASDKLNIVYDKISFITSMLMYMNLESYTFDANDMSGFGMILIELQEEVAEIKKLIDWGI